MKNTDDIVEIDLWQLVLVCLKKWWLILIVTVICGITAFTISKFFIDPTYESTVKIYVNNTSFETQNMSVSTSDFTASAKLAEVYDVILNTHDTLDMVIREAGVDYDFEELQKMLTTASVNSTQVFRVTVTSTSPEEAQLIASTIGRILPDVIGDIIDSADARIIDHARIPTEKVAPSNARNTLIGALIGFMLAVAYLVITTLMDNTIKDEAELLSVIDVPVLTYVPNFFDNSKKGTTYSRNYYGRTEADGGAK